MARLQTRRLATRPYEIVYIFDSALEDGVIAERLEKHHQLLELAEPAEIEHWGRRQLAYKIGRHENGYYVIANVQVAPRVLPEFERALKLDEGVVRYLVTLHERELGAPAGSETDGDPDADNDDSDDEE